MANPDIQWRVDNAEHLKGVPLKFQRYTKWRDDWDHDHCAGCWAKLAEDKEDGVLNEGYATTASYPRGERYEWVCSECFVDLKETLGWVAA
jgi:hypothetical protein